RLTPLGKRVGLISEERYAKFLKKQEMIDQEVERIRSVTVSPDKINPIFERCGTSAVAAGIRLGEALKRPQVTYEDLTEIDKTRPALPDAVFEEAEIRIKYEGYIKRQKLQVEQFAKMESRLLPEDTDYSQIHGLRIEARQKLDKIKPKSLGQASRISGVSPSDISVLIIWLESRKK
ncbi:MAG: tRNA uridine-5-carboxymethylaminomethyl(34) synthesis enzyme MnmG, partial [Clostridia bacterium]|nr:tRNA uridine-5-carboxymethylaminomethyl(34) synthesis enzyme MnmG [Clostridia bacterium]